MRVSVDIVGLSPLLMNRFRDEQEEGGSLVPQGTRREQATQTAYLDAKGGLYLPSSNILSALTSGGRFVKVGKMKVTTEKASLVPAALSVEGPLQLPLLDPELKVQLQAFSVDSRRVVDPTLGPIQRHRARVEAWSLHFGLEIDMGVLPSDVVKKIVQETGKKAGLGDFRPDRKGPFGRFTLTKWVETQEKVTPKSRSRQAG